ncbi:MAG: hypothetical protein V9F00_03245 [Nocardioides sp.]
MNIPIRTVLEVIRDGHEEWDTRQIDMMLGFRGATVEHGILAYLREIESSGLIEEVVGTPCATGPRWRVTEAGDRWLSEAGDDS